MLQIDRVAVGDLQHRPGDGRERRRIGFDIGTVDGPGRSRSPGRAGRSNSLLPAPSSARRRSTHRDAPAAHCNTAPTGSTTTVSSSLL
jgi:hypothetical protein